MYCCTITTASTVLAEHLVGLNDPPRGSPLIAAPSSAVFLPRSLHLLIASYELFNNSNCGSKEKVQEYIICFVESCISRGATAVVQEKFREVYPLFTLFASIRSIHPMLLLKIALSEFLKLGDQTTQMKECCYDRQAMHDSFDNFKVDGSRNEVAITLGCSELLKKCVRVHFKNVGVNLHVGIDANNRLHVSFIVDSEDQVKIESVINMGMLHYSLQLLSCELCRITPPPEVGFVGYLSAKSEREFVTLSSKERVVENMACYLRL